MGRRGGTNALTGITCELLEEDPDVSLRDLLQRRLGVPRVGGLFEERAEESASKLLVTFERDDASKFSSKASSKESMIEGQRSVDVDAWLGVIRALFDHF